MSGPSLLIESMNSMMSNTELEVILRNTIYDNLNDAGRSLGLFSSCPIPEFNVMFCHTCTWYADKQ